MSWCPDTAKVSIPIAIVQHIFVCLNSLILIRFHISLSFQQVKKKMLYSSSFDALKKSLVGVQKYIQATDLSEASQDAVEEKLRATDRQ